MVKKKLFLLDAYALIYRSYYAFIKNPQFTSAGLNTSAILGFTNTLFDILENQKPTHIAVVFDSPTKTFRHEWYSEYKANRQETPEDILRSVPYIKQITEVMNIPVIQIEGFEADDVICTLAIKARDKDYEVYMMTTDKDYAQVVDRGIFIYKPGRSGGKPEILGKEEVIKKYEIKRPAQVIDILALMGDASDNIPGAKGIGEKTAIKLIQQYETVEQLWENREKLSGKIKEIIYSDYNNILLSKRLVTIDINAPVEFNETSFVFHEPDYEQIIKIFSDLEFKNLIKRIQKNNIPDSEVTSISGELSLFDSPLIKNHSEDIIRTINNTEHKYYLVDTESSRKLLLKELQQSAGFCFDTETTGLEIHLWEIVGIAFAVRPYEAWYLPLPEDQQAACSIIQEFREVFADSSKFKVGQNIKFDLQVLSKYDIVVNGLLYDTMIAHYLLEPELRHNMDYLARHYLKYIPVPIESLIGEKGKNQRNMRNVPIHQIKEYACEDADITLQLYLVLFPKLKETGLYDLYIRIEEPLIRVLTDMELYGVKIDPVIFKDQSQKLSSELIKIEEEIFAETGERFNISSPQQLGHILFNKLKIIDNPVKTKTRQFSTSEEVLEKLTDSHPVIEKILEYRGLRKLLNTYIEVLPGLINSLTGRIHTSFNQTVTATGRLSSNNPNLQNIPIREQRGREIRKGFIPSSHAHILLSADYSQIELRIMAHLSNDTNMINAFKNQLDIHTDTAARIFNTLPEKVTPEMRRKAKTANFGIIYGISAFGLASRLNISRKDAQELIEGYFRSYPGIKTYMIEIINLAKKQGFVQTLFGRRRILKDIHSNNSTVRAFAERNAINAPIQGTAADIIKLAMSSIAFQIKRQGLTSRMILQVHDELVFDVLNTELEQIKQIVKDGMEKVVELNVPLIADIGVGKNWLEAH